MVRTLVHTCNICNKNYASYQSLCNHRSKKHDNPSIILDNTLIIPDNTSIISTPFENETVKTYDCKHCNRAFNNYQNRWKHQKICKNKNTEIIKKNLEIIENNGTINNGTINNITNITNSRTINNNIIINSFGKEDISYLTDALFKNTLIRLSRHDDESLKKAIPRIAQLIHFNEDFKENNNMEIASIKSKTAKKYIDGQWKYVKKDEMLKEVHTKIVELLQKWVDSHRLEITRAMMGGLKTYKLVSPEYIKKMIHEEINLLGYVYKKNHMDNDII
jgi:hypothetical protein